MTEVDVEHQIKAVERKVGTRLIDAVLDVAAGAAPKEAHVVTISQSYDTDQEDLWDAVTSIERVPRWLLPITGDLRLGGSYQLEGQAGGTVLACDPPKNFTATWEFGGGVSWIDVSVIADGPDRARLVIEHIAHVDDHWDQFGPGAVGMGWDSMVLGLAIHLSTGEAVDPAFGQQWIVTEDGRRFLALSGEAWCAANVASGTDPAAAGGMAERCLKAYLGEV